MRESPDSSGCRTAVRNPAGHRTISDRSLTNVPQLLRAPHRNLGPYFWCCARLGRASWISPTDGWRCSSTTTVGSQPGLAAAALVVLSSALDVAPGRPLPTMVARAHTSTLAPRDRGHPFPWPVREPHGRETALAVPRRLVAHDLERGAVCRQWSAHAG